MLGAFFPKQILLVRSGTLNGMVVFLHRHRMDSKYRVLEHVEGGLPWNSHNGSDHGDHGGKYTGYITP